MNEQVSGIINILKPSGMTSHDVVYKIRKKFNIQCGWSIAYCYR